MGRLAGGFFRGLRAKDFRQHSSVLLSHTNAHTNRDANAGTTPLSTLLSYVTLDPHTCAPVALSIPQELWGPKQDRPSRFAPSLRKVMMDEPVQYVERSLKGLFD